MTSKPHNFAPRTFRAPTACDHCRKLMWGLAHQGVSCIDCGMNAHKKCRKQMVSVSDLCEPADLVSVNSDSSLARQSGTSSKQQQELRQTKSQSELMPRKNKRQTTADQPPIISILSQNFLVDEEASVATSAKPVRASSNTFVTPISSPVQVQAQMISPYDSPPRSPTPPESLLFDWASPASSDRNEESEPVVKKAYINKPRRSHSGSMSLLKDLIHTTAEKSVNAATPKFSPPLNLLSTMPKNSTRFLLKIGPMATFQDKVEEVVLWQTPTETLLVMTLFSLICLNPFLILFAPQCLLIGMIVLNYYNRAKKAVNSKSTKIKSHKKALTASDMKPASIVYSKNMRFIQNTMGMYCDIYENVCLMNTHIDWSNERQTMLVLQAAIASIVALAFIWSFVPWNLVVLAVGWVSVLSNTSIGRALQIVLVKHAEEQAQSRQVQLLVARFKQLSTYISGNKAMNEAFTNKDGQLYVELVENQRKWAGVGFTGSMLKKERSNWSDSTGDISMHPTDSYDDPNSLIRAGMCLTLELSPITVSPAFKWQWTKDSEWFLDNKSWGGDNEGWMYYDQKWLASVKSSSADCSTRCRRWLRKAVVMASDADTSRKSK